MSIANYEEFNQKKRDLIDIMMLLAEQIDHICDVGLDLDAEVLVDLKCKLEGLSRDLCKKARRGL